MSEYVEYLKEVFESFGSVQPRRMFGGYGVFHKGLMFALVSDETLYLKADETNSRYFTERELEHSVMKSRERPSNCLTTWHRMKFLMTLKKPRCGLTVRLPPPFAQTI